LGGEGGGRKGRDLEIQAQVYEEQLKKEDPLHKCHRLERERGGKDNNTLNSIAPNKSSTRVSSNIGVDSIYSTNCVIQWRFCQAAGFSAFLLHGKPIYLTYLSIIIPQIHAPTISLHPNW
jgi:hypothetical protein